MRTPLTKATPDLNSIFDAHAGRIFGFLLTRCGSAAVAEDLTADTFQAASARFASGRGNEVTAPWLYTVARRRLIDHWRSENTKQRGIERLKTESARAVAVQHSPDTAVEAALDSLPDRYRAALVLRYLEGFSVSEVAEALQLSYKATESLLTRARRAFAKSYESLNHD